MKLTFIGATGTVTGSKYLLEDANQKILIDCGLFQGRKDLRERNWDTQPFDPAGINAVLLTHAHLDHCGYIPKLVKDGFRGPVYCSEATFDLAKIILKDSGRIQEGDAEQANRYGYTKHRPAVPLYTEEEAEAAFRYFKPLPFAKKFRIENGFLDFSLHRAGHILGAAFIKISDGQTSILFSGDLGRMNDPVMKAPSQIEEADYLVVESTYGDRLHDKDDPTEDIGDTIRRTAARGGTVVIPAFAVGRAQAILYHIHRLKKERKIPAHLPVFLDSPMAINASEIMARHLNDHKLGKELCAEVCSAAQYTRTPQESKMLDHEYSHMPAVIITASGMATGGRVLHHLKRFIGDPRHTILLAGFQAEGTRGGRLARGEKELKIHGQLWPVRAEIVQLHNMSAHADYSEILSWLSGFVKLPKKIFITHGEASAAESLRKKIIDSHGGEAIVPEYLEVFEL